MKSSRALLFCLCLCVLVAAGAAPGLAAPSSLKAGKAALASAGVMTFGPDAVLFVADPRGGAVWALDTGDRTPGSGAVELDGVDSKIAAMMGTTPEGILVRDMAVNPISKKVYLSVSRGRGPDGAPVILRIDSAGKIDELSLGDIAHARAELPNPVSADAKDRRGRSLRMQAITDLAFLDGKVYIAGLSNEEFASNLRSIDFPFSGVSGGTSVEIYHGNHGKWETRSPVRSFVPYEIQAEAHLLAAYTCTPLVKFPVAELKPGTKVVGSTIAELGNRNVPLDMVTYSKGGKNFILMSNSSRGVMKIGADNLEGFDGITNPVEDKEGVPYETITSLEGVEQLDKLDDNRAVIVARSGDRLNIRTIALP